MLVTKEIKYTKNPSVLFDHKLKIWLINYHKVSYMKLEKNFCKKRFQRKVRRFDEMKLDMDCTF